MQTLNGGGQVSSIDCLQIRKSLLSWYDENHRILPWRRNYHSRVAETATEEKGVSLEMPQQQFMYGIWISEVHQDLVNMLLLFVGHLVLKSEFLVSGRPLCSCVKPFLFGPGDVTANSSP